MLTDRHYATRRARLVASLRDKGISNEGVLSAIGTIPRHQFVDDIFKKRAYEDEALPIGLGQTISQPFTVAYQTELLDPQPGDRILEIGTGSGYQAAILAEMGARVFSVERHEMLLERTNQILSELGYDLRTRHGDGTFGWPALAPFDGILVTAGAHEVPHHLLDQLRVEGDQGRRGGRLVIPIGSKSGQTMNRITRLEENSYRREEMNTFRFVPLIGEGGGGIAP